MARGAGAAVAHVVDAAMSRTGFFIALEMCAASSAASKNSRRPKEPPPWTTCTVTLFSGSPSSCAMVCFATIGDFSPAQMVALSSRTSATAELDSIGAWLTNAKSNSPSTCCVSSGGTAKGSAAPCSFSLIVSLLSPSTVPAFHVTSRAFLPSSAWPKVSDITATPVGTTARSLMPGIARTAASLVTFFTVPLIVGGRRTITGIAPGMSRSSV